MKSAIRLLLAASLMLPMSALFAAELIEPFLGSYKGHATFTTNGVTVERDLSVDIPRDRAPESRHDHHRGRGS